MCQLGLVDHRISNIMDKRKMKNQDSNTEIKKKKQKKNKDSEFTADQNDCQIESSGKQKVHKKKANDLNLKVPSMQNLLTEKLKRVQNKRSEKIDFENTKKIEEAKKVEEARKSIDQVPNNKNLDNVDSKSNLHGKNKRNKKENTDRNGEEKAVIAESVKTDHVQNELGEEEEVDPEKAAIREKKREKRKQKKLDKQKLKQQNADRAGSGQKAAIEYLNQWKNSKDEWKFLKVRQVWLLQNMYDQKMVEDDSFEILLEYLEGLQGKSREVTVSEAEKVLEKPESNDEESSSVITDRARQIIQLLSD